MTPPTIRVSLRFKMILSDRKLQIEVINQLLVSKFIQISYICQPPELHILLYSMALTINNRHYEIMWRRRKLPATVKDIIIRIPVHSYHEIKTTFISMRIHDVIDVNQILKLIYLDRKLKINANSYHAGVFNFRYPLNKFVANSNWRPFCKFWNVKHNFNLPSDMKRSRQSMSKIAFHDVDRVASKSVVYIPPYNK